MQYHLETIPVWEAMEKESNCPLCALYQKCEETEIDRSLGGSVMEPDARIRVNDRGICDHHHQLLFAMQNRLGHALLVDSHSKELLKKLDGLDKITSAPTAKKGLFSAKTDSVSLLADELEKLSTSCVVCEDIESHMKRYLYTFLHLWKTDTAFRKKWEASKGVCIPHAVELLRFSVKQLNAANQQLFAQSLLSLLKSNLAEDEKDLEWFTLKFDYRNQSKPWGNSRNALERTINRLRGECIVNDAKEKE